MFTIGDFARHGRVSVRMLRHYDAIGMLRPARVDPSSGYRFYDAAQLSRLNRIVALKDLGFTLPQVQAMLDQAVSPDELRGMLRLRRAELEAAIGQAADRLVRVEARLRSIESEGSMRGDDIVLKTLPAVRLAELTATVASFSPDEIGPVLRRLFAELRPRVAGVGPDTVYFETDDDRIVVHAGIPVDAGSGMPAGVPVVTLPEVEQAAAIVHRGVLNGFLATSQTLVRWVEAHGYRFDGYVREITLNASDDPDGWVAELQAPICV